MPEIGMEVANWYAVYTRSHFEQRVAGDLAARGIEYFLPAVEEIHRWKDRRKNISVPLFPGYLFARMADTPAARLAVLQTTGAVSILGCGAAITPVPDMEIDAVRTLVAARAQVGPSQYLPSGTKVRVRSGALSGVEGFLVRIKNTWRVVVSVHLLSQSVAAEVDLENIERVD